MLESLIKFASRHQRRFARLVLFGGVVYAALVLWPAWPRETEVEFALGPSHADVIELRVAYLQDGHELHGVAFSYPGGAPAHVHHRVTLPSGTFVIRCELRVRSGGAHEMTHTLHTPADRRVQIRLAPPTRAGLAVRPDAA